MTVSGAVLVTFNVAMVSTVLFTVLEVTLWELVELLAVALLRRVVPLGVDAFTVPFIITQKT